MPTATATKPKTRARTKKAQTQTESITPVEESKIVSQMLDHAPEKEPTIENMRTERSKAYFYCHNVNPGVTVIDATLEVVTQKTCGGGKSSYPYVHGNRLLSGVIDSRLEWQVVEYDEKTKKFTIQGNEITGAKIVSLSREGCWMSAVDPVFASEG